ncbi:MAG TPA: YajQ family cyclic di-GMP-binding protein [Bryobacterales bacterium]|nr:YajQ family cyclic di-GMP-binding protein [Bryobacterales bacterium]
MAANSFDIVSRIDLQEVNNAIQQAAKEVLNRYDLKNTKSTIELDADGSKIVIRSSDDFTIKQVVDVLDQKLIRRGIPLKGLSYGPVKEAGGSTVLLEIALQQGIPIEKAREIVKLIKNRKLKVQSSIQGDQVRVTGNKRDDLQEVIAMLKEQDLGIDMQFSNYRSN